MTLALGPTFIEDFRLSKEPAFLIDSRIFTLGRAGFSTKEDNIFHFLGSEYALEESEELKNLENELYKQKSKDIETYIRDLIKKEYTTKVNKINNEISGLLSRAGDNKGFSVEKFIVCEVFYEYINRENKGHKKEIRAKKPIVKKQFSTIPKRSFSYPSAEEVRGKRQIIDCIIRQPVLILGERAFYMMVTHKPREIFIKYNNRFYVATKSGLSSELEQDYVTRVLQDIRKRAFDYKTGLDELLKENYDQLNRIKDTVLEEDRFTEIRNKQVEDIGFKKLDSRTYQLHLDIPSQYSVDKNRIRVATEIIADADSITLTGPARVIEGNPDCEHVFSGGRICYDGTKRWKKRGVVFRKYSANELREEKVAYQLAVILEEAKTIVESGNQ